MKINDSLSLNALRQLDRSNKAIARSLGRLASGSRINQSQDDAAGLAIASGLDAQVRGIKRGIQNMNEAQGYLATADGALAEQTNIVQRLRELALQSANGTLGANDRSALNTEFQKLVEELDRIGTQTNFNGTKLLDGSFATQAIQIGARKGESLDLKLTSSRLTDLIKAQVTSGTGTFRKTLETSGTVSEVTQIVATDIGANLDGKYFLFDDPNLGATYVWFDLDGNGNDPTIANRVGIAVFLDSADPTTDTVASAIQSALVNAGVAASVSGSTVTVTSSPGSVTDSVDGDTGFSISTITQGVGTSLNLSVGSQPFSSPVLADINGDGKLDLLQSNNNSNDISVFLNNGLGGFTQSQTLSVGSFPTSSPVLTDINGDGKLDLLQTNRFSNNISVFLNNGSGGFTQSQTLSVGSFPTSKPVLTDINGDGKLDLLQSNNNSNNISVFLNNGSGGFTQAQTLSVGSRPRTSPVLVDINGDGKLDLLQANSNSNNISVFLNNGLGGFTQSQTLSVGSFPSSSPVLTDINGDGKLDLLQTNSSSNNISVFLNNGSGGFTQAQTLSVGISPTSSPIFADINGDGKLDLLQTNSSSNNISVFLNNGSGSFTQAQTLSVGSNPSSSPVLTDINGDGKLDILQSNNNSNNISVFLNNGLGGFTQAQTLSVGLAPDSSPVLVDINGDGNLDLLQTNSSSNNISVFFQNTQTSVDPVLGDELAIDTQEHAQNMLDALDNALTSLSTNRASIGALQSRLNFATNVASVTNENLAQARSQVLDTDYASETADLIRSQILQQAGVAVLAQANLQSRALLQLLNF